MSDSSPTESEPGPRTALRWTRWHWLALVGWFSCLLLADAVADLPSWLMVGASILGLYVLRTHAEGSWRPGTRGRVSLEIGILTALAAALALLVEAF